VRAEIPGHHRGRPARFALFKAGVFGHAARAVKWLKLFAAVLLLPACAALTRSVWQLGRGLLAGGDSGPAAAAFWAGYALWLAVFVVLPKPVRLYVLGHELTHALWALLMGAKVRGLRVRKTGGEVRTSKSNWLIALAPYFFPFYAMVFVAVFFLAHAIWNLQHQMHWLFFLLGLGWSFHVTFTLMTLLCVRQPDVQSQGMLFSAVTIYCMNLVVIALSAAALSREITVAGLLERLGADLALAYGWTLDKLLGLWHALRRLRAAG
jgi:hypothetical protein